MLSKIKKKYLWFIILKILVVPIYDFFWKNIINIHGRFLNFLWFSKKKNVFFKLSQKSAIYKIENNEELQKLTSRILLACNKNILEEAEKEIKSLTYENINESNK